MYSLDYCSQWSLAREGEEPETWARTWGSDIYALCSKSSNEWIWASVFGDNEARGRASSLEEAQSKAEKAHHFLASLV